MRKSLIGYSLIFVAALSLLTLLFFFQTTVFKEGFKVTLITASASLLMLLPCGFASKAIVDNYEKRQWQVNWLSSMTGGIASFFYAAAVAGVMNTPDSLLVLLVFLSLIIGSILGIFATSIMTLAIGVGLLVAMLTIDIFIFTYTNLLFRLGAGSSLCLGLFIISGSVGYIAVFGIPLWLRRSQRKVTAEQRSQAELQNLEALTLDLLQVARHKKKALTKAEIMVELQISATTADALLQEAEINQLCSVELDQRDGTLRYRFPVE
jgi:hypothetical protein